MIEFFAANTPNGKKISIMLEEIGYEYKVTNVDLSNDEQFKPEFKKISPFNKIPVIIDHDNNESIFGSGAILIYLGEKSNKLYEKKEPSERYNRRRLFIVNQVLYSILSLTSKVFISMFFIAQFATNFPWRSIQQTFS